MFKVKGGYFKWQDTKSVFQKVQGVSDLDHCLRGISSGPLNSPAEAGEMAQYLLF